MRAFSKTLKNNTHKIEFKDINLMMSYSASLINHMMSH